MQRLELSKRLGLTLLLVGLSLGGVAQSVSARVVQADLTLEAETSPTFTDLIRQAERLAEKSVSQAFEQSDVTDVLIRLSGDRAGELVPLLTVAVTRSDWQKDPNVRSYTRYYGMSARLLKFETQVAQSETASVSRTLQNSQDDPAFRDD